MLGAQPFINMVSSMGAGGRARGPDSPPGNSLAAICFLRHSGIDTPGEAIGPDGSNCFSWEVHTGLCETCW